MVSNLENFAIVERQTTRQRMVYDGLENVYNASHPNALSTGDLHGKGTGHSGHGHWLPNQQSSISTMNNINYSNFDTADNTGLARTGAGNLTDYNARIQALNRQLYGPQNPYESIDTSRNRHEGQYVVR